MGSFSRLNIHRDILSLDDAQHEAFKQVGLTFARAAWGAKWTFILILAEDYRIYTLSPCVQGSCKMS